MNFIKKLFGLFVKQRKLNFTKILDDPGNLTVFLPALADLTYEVVARIVSWENIFAKLIFIVPENEFTFFSNLKCYPNVIFINSATEFTLTKSSVLINFDPKQKLHKYIKRNHDTIIIDINSNSNLQFIPNPTSPLTYISKFSEYFDIPVKRYSLMIEPDKRFNNVKQNTLIKNRFSNFIIDVSKSISKKQINVLTAELKQHFSANIYFLDKEPGKNDFINIKKLEAEHLFDEYQYSCLVDLHITDDANKAKLFTEQNSKILYIGEQHRLKNVKTASLNNVSELKNTVKEMLK